MITTISAGASVRAALSLNRNVLALEGDREIFNELLLPLSIPALPPPSTPDTVNAELAGDDSPVHAAKRDGFCEWHSALIRFPLCNHLVQYSNQFVSLLVQFSECI